MLHEDVQRAQLPMKYQAEVTKQANYANQFWNKIN